jgi:hypothetical protein
MTLFLIVARRAQRLSRARQLEAFLTLRLMPDWGERNWRRTLINVFTSSYDQLLHGL